MMMFLFVNCISQSLTNVTKVKCPQSPAYLLDAQTSGGGGGGGVCTKNVSRLFLPAFQHLDLVAVFSIGRAKIHIQGKEREKGERVK